MTEVDDSRHVLVNQRFPHSRGYDFLEAMRCTLLKLLAQSYLYPFCGKAILLLLGPDETDCRVNVLRMTQFKLQSSGLVSNVMRHGALRCSGFSEFH